MTKINPKLSPVKHARKIGEKKWLSTGDDPSFLLETEPTMFFTGWISIKIKVSSATLLEPKIYFDYGEGFSEVSTVMLHKIDIDSYCAELMLPFPVKSMRFDPVDRECEFTIHSISIQSHNNTIHIFKQLISVLHHDYKKGNEIFRIIKKSYARYRKHGKVGMLERLNKEYKVLYPDIIQKFSSEYTLYLNWMHQNEQDVYHKFDAGKYPYQPLITIVMPTFNSQKKYLIKAIKSVIGQTYPHWELCIADDASFLQETIDTLNEYNKKYNNISVVFRSKNGHISRATDSAIELAKGEFIAFLDHDDTISPNALTEVVKRLNQNQHLKLIYSDEDKIDETDRRSEPHFKSSWNPDMFFSQNYISHLTVLKKEIIDKVGGLRVGYEGAQDYDLLLRTLRYINEKEIAHIPKILYHWRMIPGSTAKESSQKAYTTDAGIKALEDYFSHKENLITVQKGLLPNTYKVNYPLPKKQPLVSLLIPTRDGYSILSKCIESILEKTSYKNYEIIILDNQTTDQNTLDYFSYLIKNYSNITILPYDKPFNYAAINNFGVKHAKGELIGLVNNDIELISNHWLEELVQHAIRPEIGAVGTKLYYDNDTIQHAGVILGIGGVAGHAHKYFKRDEHGYFSRLKIIQNYSAVTSACLLVRKEIYEEVYGMNEKHLKIAFNDTDLCIKILEKGYRNLWTPYVELYHHESVSRGTEDNDEKRNRFNSEVDYMQKRWGTLLTNDPYYSKNLTLIHENFQIKTYTSRSIEK